MQVNLEIYRRIFIAKPQVKFIELDTYRTCIYDYPYNPALFAFVYDDEQEKSFLTCINKSITRITFDDLPLGTYVDRHLQIHSLLSVRYMFKDCTELTSVESGAWNLRDVIDFYGMFANCVSLTRIFTIEWLVKGPVDISYMFNNCAALKGLYLNCFSNITITNAVYTFGNCYNLIMIEYADKWDISPCADMTGMFANTYNLVTVNGICNWNVRINLPIDITDMFKESRLTIPDWYKNKLAYQTLTNTD